MKGKTWVCGEEEGRNEFAGWRNTIQSKYSIDGDVCGLEMLDCILQYSPPLTLGQALKAAPLRRSVPLPVHRPARLLPGSQSASRMPPVSPEPFRQRFRPHL